MLLQVPKGIGGAKIRTAAVTASITGTTIMMEYHPKKSIKVLVLEGSLRLSVNGTIRRLPPPSSGKNGDHAPERSSHSRPRLG